MEKIYPIKLTHPLVLKVSTKRYAANTNVLEHSYDPWRRTTSHQYRAFACDVMAAMLVYLDKRILNIFFWKYTNMAANFFVVLIHRDWVKTLYRKAN